MSTLPFSQPFTSPTLPCQNQNRCTLSSFVVPATHIIHRMERVDTAPNTPILSTLHFPYTALPEEVYPLPSSFVVPSLATTFAIQPPGSSSNCQTLIVNGPNNFHIWCSPTPNGSIGDKEAKVIAYCTQNTHGACPIPFGAITGLPVHPPLMSKLLDSSITLTLSCPSTDSGGELDPHGADLQGDPLGGVVYSNATSDSTDGSLVHLNVFVGRLWAFLLKNCDNSITSPDHCLNTYDLVGKWNFL